MERFGKVLTAFAQQIAAVQTHEPATLIRSIQQQVGKRAERYPQEVMEAIGMELENPFKDDLMGQHAAQLLERCPAGMAAKAHMQILKAAGARINLPDPEWVDDQAPDIPSMFSFRIDCSVL